MSRIEWINCPKCGHRMQRDTVGNLHCERCESWHDAIVKSDIILEAQAVSPNYIEMANLRGEEILELRAKNLRLEWQLAIAKTRLRLIRKNALYATKVQSPDPTDYDEWMNDTPAPAPTSERKPVAPFQNKAEVIKQIEGYLDQHGVTMAQALAALKLKSVDGLPNNFEVARKLIDAKMLSISAEVDAIESSDTNVIELPF